MIRPSTARIWRRLRSPLRTLGVGLLVFCLQSSLFSLELAPADDFSSSLYRPAAASSAYAMSVHRIEEILTAKLRTTPPKQILRLARHLYKLCHHYRFDPAFVLSMIQVESSFRTNVVSPVGAIGLMQLMPATAGVVVRDMKLSVDAHTLKVLRQGRELKDHLWIVSRQLLMDPYINVSLGVAYLAFLRDRYRDLHPYYLVAAYNLGPARMDELMSRKGFKPDKTRKYFEAIRQGVAEFRTYGHSVSPG